MDETVHCLAEGEEVFVFKVNDSLYSLLREPSLASGTLLALKMKSRS